MERSLPWLWYVKAPVIKLVKEETTNNGYYRGPTIFGIILLLCRGCPL